MRKFRFHILGLAHTVTHPCLSPCAYTQKVLKLCRMLTELGHDVTHYGAEDSMVACRHVTVVSRQVQEETYAGHNTDTDFFAHNPTDRAYTTFAGNAIREINARKQPDDFLLVPFGNYQENIARAVNLPLTVESGIGYGGTFAKFRVFESYAWMSNIQGAQGTTHPSSYDVVIPNYYDPADFPPNLGETNGNLLFVGRLIASKGLQTAIDVARVLGRRLLVAGQGRITDFNTDGADVKYIGVLGAVRRAINMRNSACLMVPTQYIGPFEGVAVEAQMCGTPVVTSDWGVFPETVVHGVTGWRCRTFEDYLHGAENACALNRAAISSWAVANYSVQRVAGMYQEYFEKVHDLLDGKGWSTPHPERKQLDWLRVVRA